jgi:hypothetical protein
MAMNGGRVTAVHELAREIQNSTQGQVDGAGCLAIAQAELEVLRIRAVVSTVFAQILNGLAVPRPAIGSRELEKETARPPLLAEKPSFAAGYLVGGIEQLRILDRYLRRALAKRDRAVRLAFEHAFDAARLSITTQRITTKRRSNDD